jgi:hypothetical protein
MLVLARRICGEESCEDAVKKTKSKSEAVKTSKGK